MKLKASMLILMLGLAGCSDEPVTQRDCLAQGEFEYNGRCEQFHNIPESEQENVVTEIADEIAESRGITREEALQILWDIVNEGE